MGRLTNVEKARRALEAANSTTAIPTSGAISSDPVRPQIKQMSGFASEGELHQALPENTMLPGMESDTGPQPAKRPRRTKAEMDALRGRAGLESDDPNMLDPRYKKAVEEMRSAGLSTTVQTGFKTYAVVSAEPEWELEHEEFEKVDNFSYVLSKKYGVLDPTKHWIGMAFYFFALMGGFIFKRAAKMNAESWMKKLHGFFAPEPEEQPDKKPVTQGE